VQVAAIRAGNDQPIRMLGRDGMDDDKSRADVRAHDRRRRHRRIWRAAVGVAWDWSVVR
jgi:hypothetical protein